jgi:hypothetical protein
VRVSKTNVENAKVLPACPDCVVISDLSHLHQAV